MLHHQKLGGSRSSEGEDLFPPAFSHASALERAAVSEWWRAGAEWGCPRCVVLKQASIVTKTGESFLFVLGEDGWGFLCFCFYSEKVPEAQVLPSF